MQLLIKYGNIVLTTTTGHRVRYHLCLILLLFASTSDRLHSEFVRLLFLQSHRDTDRFFATSGVRFAQSTSGQFHFRRAAFSQELTGKVGLALAKAAALHITSGFSEKIALREGEPVCVILCVFSVLFSGFFLRKR
jgi:hypothetical protein